MDRKINYMLLFWIFSLVWKILQLVQGFQSEIRSPWIMNYSDSETKIEVGSSFKVICKGDRKAVWIIPELDRKNSHQLVISNSKSFRNDSGITTFYSKLEITNASADLTGLYVCASQHNTSRESFYLYVYDPRQLFISTPTSVIYYSTSGSLTIPCRASTPLLSAILRQKDKVLQVSDNLKYDPKVGFQVQKTPENFSGAIQCYGQVDGPNQTADFYLYNLDTDPPELDIAKDVVVVPLGQDLVISCRANGPLVWEHPKLGGSETKFLVTTSTTTSLQIQSELRVVNAVANTTGWISCRYNFSDSDRFIERTTASVYVFFTDPDVLLIQDESNFATELEYDPFSNRPLILNCRITNPNVTVALWKADNTAEVQVSDPDMISYDPFRGFVVLFPDLFYQGLFFCKASFNQQKGILRYEVKFGKELLGPDELAIFHLKNLKLKYRAPINKFYVMGTDLKIENAEVINIQIRILPFKESKTHPKISMGNAPDHVDDKVMSLTGRSQDWIPPIPKISYSYNGQPKAQEDFTLNCRAIFEKLNDCEPKLTWIYPNKQVLKRSNDNSVVYKSFENLNDQLHIVNFSASDTGIYSCLFSCGNKVSKSDVYLQINNKSSSEFSLSSSSGSLVEKQKDSQVYFKVSITGIDIQSLSLSWEKNGLIVPFGGRFRETRTGQLVGLTISQLIASDAGLYTLTARTTDGWKRVKNVTIGLVIRYLVPVSIDNTLNYFDSGKTYMLNCKGQGYPLPLLKWNWKPCHESTDCDFYSDDDWLDVPAIDGQPTNQGKLLSPDSFKPDESQLQLTVVASHSGYYRCSGSNALGGTQENLRFVVSDVQNGFQLNTSKSDPFEKDRMNITCLANSFIFSTLEFYWKPVSSSGGLANVYFNSEMKLLHQSTMYSHELILEVDSVSLNNSGEYYCTAWYRHGGDMEGENITSVQTIQVKAPESPKFSDQNGGSNIIQYLNLDDNVTMDCSATGKPQPFVQWYKDQKPLPINPRYLLADHGQQLVILRITRKDFGTFNCTATNNGGSASHTITLLIINEKPKLETHTIMKTIGTSKTTKKLNVLLIGAGMVVTLLFLAGCCCMAKRFFDARKERHERELTSQRLFYKGQIERLSSHLPLDEQADLLPYDPKWEFPKERLSLSRILGQGAFGRVVKGEAIGIVNCQTVTPVAVKVLKEQADSMQRKSLLAELKILIFLGRHINIVNLLGAVTRERKAGELMLIVEYCPYGNLQNFLQEHRRRFVDQRDPETGHLDHQVLNLPSSPLPFVRALKEKQEEQPLHFTQDYRLHPLNACNSVHFEKESQKTEIMDPEEPVQFPNRTVTTSDLISYAFQCARAMDYISSRKLIHRDLAARNVLLCENNIVKICDFGLSKNSYSYKPCLGKQEVPVPLPVKWMAVESLRERKFSSKSDVLVRLFFEKYRTPIGSWAFGVLMWEFFTLGEDPYTGAIMNEDFYRKLKAGHRLQKPEFASNNLYRVMQHCWQADPTERPTFSQLVENLGGMLEAEVREHYVMLNEPYTELNAKDPYYVTTGGYINKLFEEIDQRAESEQNSCDMTN